MPYPLQLDNVPAITQSPPLTYTTLTGRLSPLSTSSMASHRQLTTTSHRTKAAHGSRVLRAPTTLFTEAFSIDITKDFLSLRKASLEQLDLQRITIQKRFIKLAKLLGNAYIHNLNHRPTFMLLLAGTHADEYSKRAILEAEMEIVGEENWQDDKDATCCSLCFSRFTLINRKHHCRLCGGVVDDQVAATPDGRSSCSAQVPVAILLQMLPKLNYLPEIKALWDILCSAESSDQGKSLIFSFRCCKTCKNHLIHGVKASADSSHAESALFANFEEFLILKLMIGDLSAKYSSASKTTSIDDPQLFKIRAKMVDCIKELEKRGAFFKNQASHLAKDNVESTNSTHQILTMNMYKSLMMFLLDALQNLKAVNDAGEKVSSGKSSPESSAQATPEIELPPRLNKREIRERREQLMVVNEQKFLVENLIENTRKQRKFDEVATLEESKRDLEEKIKELELELGEYGF